MMLWHCMWFVFVMLQYGVCVFVCDVFVCGVWVCVCVFVSVYVVCVFVIVRICVLLSTVWAMCFDMLFVVIDI